MTKRNYAMPGDQIRRGHTLVTIQTVHYSDNFGGGYGDPDNWYIELTDTNGRYRYWKQEFDGGELIMKDPEPERFNAYEDPEAVSYYGLGDHDPYDPFEGGDADDLYEDL